MERSWLKTMSKVLALNQRGRGRHSAKNSRVGISVGVPNYTTFDQLDGSHPLQEAVPESCVLYPVRVIPNAKVLYFNWDLAREMGLLTANHPNHLSRALEEKILETFSIRIINEWDQKHKVQIPKGLIKKNRYMATRYLQLQHSDKSGRTSGDGRCIWNGIVKNRGRTWDVSSRGTGVTALAPGVVLAGKPLKSGNNEHGYGCGMAEIDELYAAAIMAEVFHRNGIPTERILAIVDLGKGMGIGVRASPNLLRPAHLFSHLRQGELQRLKRATDYFIDRQHTNGEWKFSSTHRRRYLLLLHQLTADFARFAAYLDRDYIFAWLDWDGDNVLANAGIIDYGSVRQFGLRHDQYRYDDIERFSTNLNEQRVKARQIIQVFAQMTDYLQTGSRQPLEKFVGHPALKRFDLLFEHHLYDRFLHQVGFTPDQRERLLTRQRPLIGRLYREFSRLERTKTCRKLRRVADGVNRPAIFNMRQVLAELPHKMLANLERIERYQMPDEELFDLMLSDFASGKDKRLTRRLTYRLHRLQRFYKQLVTRAAPREPMRSFLEELSLRASRINRRDRITGNGLLYVVDELLKARRKGFPDRAIEEIISAVIDDQTLAVEMRHTPTKPVPSAATQQLWSQVLTLVQDHREEI
jgi:uncharacterized protein YdiU (UPF0061 family)